ncbi:hypothetical protein CVT25_003144 [Psilocybe cyanescens]|uniref:Uncharacterized protein n=1 Tax=Psilocybe cyanescens TaxID=93625 RepID=A0A409XK89_PSICY|nr:hypothetical protein CVT25_003144 [Psilocybe cyanescens]
MYHVFIPTRVEAEYNYSPDDEERYRTKLVQVSRWIDHTSREEPIHPYMPAFNEDAPWETYYRYLPQPKQWPETQISDWVHNTLRHPLANPFTPQTPRSLTPLQTEYEAFSTHEQYSPQLKQQQKPYLAPYTIPQETINSPTRAKLSNWSRLDSNAPPPTMSISSRPEGTFIHSYSTPQNMQQQTEVHPEKSYTFPATQVHTHPTTLIPPMTTVNVQEYPTPQGALAPTNLLSTPQSNTTYTSVYSYPSSRTESTDYGMFYTRMAISQQSEDTVT